MRTFYVDTVPGGQQACIQCNQFETGDTWRFQLFYGGGRYDIPAGATVKITGTKADKAAFAVAATVDSNEVVVAVTEQITAAAGRCIAELLIESDGAAIYSANFVIMVEPAAVQGELSTSTVPLSITDADGNVYVQSDLDVAAEALLERTAEDQYQQDLAAGVAKRVVEEYTGSTLAGVIQSVKSAIDGLSFSGQTFYNSGYFSRVRFTGDTDHIIQGGTMHDGLFYMLTPSTDYTSGYIVEVENQTVNRRAAVAGGGHMNDVTYCDKDNCFYIATGSTNICKVNATTLNQMSDVTVANDIVSILWDNTNEWFFCVTRMNYYKYAYDWTLIESGTASFRSEGFGGSTADQNGQSSFLIGSYYGWATNYVISDLYVRNAFIIFDPITLDVISEFDFPAARGDDEVQFAAYEDGILHAVSGNNVVRFYRSYIDKTKGNGIRDTVIPFNTTGYPLAASTNLSGIARPGYYYADSRETTPVTNAPGYYNNGEAQFLQMPFGLNSLMGLFFNGERASFRYSGAYHTLLTHKDLTYQLIGDIHLYTFMGIIGIACGTVYVTCDNALSIPLPLSTTPAFAVGAPVVGYTSDTDQVVYGYRGYSNGALVYRGGDASITSAQRRCRVLAVFLFKVNDFSYYS